MTQLLHVCLALKGRACREKALVDFEHHLSSDLWRQVVEVDDIEDAQRYSLADKLFAVAVAVESTTYMTAMGKTLADALGRDAPSALTDQINQWANVTREQQVVVFSKVLDFIAETQDWAWKLDSLAPFLPAELLDKVLGLAKNTQGSVSRVRALVALIEPVRAMGRQNIWQTVDFVGDIVIAN